MSLPPPPSPLPSVPCPNCGMPWPGDATVCPNCGYIRPALPAWTPAPAGLESPYLLPPINLITGKTWGDMTLGVVVSFLSCNAIGIGYIAMPILYFVLKPKYPVFARGIGFGFLVGAVLILGALALCIGALTLSNFLH